MNTALAGALLVALLLAVPACAVIRPQGWRLLRISVRCHLAVDGT
ncbi:hypothetical protein [Streptomyces eurythermus]